MKKIELELKPTERPVTTSVNVRVSRPESTRVKAQKILRLSVANFKFKKASDLEYLISPPTTNRESKDKQTKPRQDEIFASTVRSGPRKITLPNFSLKQPGVRIVKVNSNIIRGDSKPAESLSSSPTNQLDFMTIKATTPQQNFHKKSFTAIHQHGFFKVTEIEPVKMVRLNNQNPIRAIHGSDSTSSPSMDKKIKLSFQENKIQNSKKAHFCTDGSVSNFEEEATECTQNTQHKNTNLFLETGKARVINFSTSLSSQNTLMVEPYTPSYLNNKEEERKYYNSAASTPKDRVTNNPGAEAIKIESALNQKSYKTLARINEAKRNANLYNDQIIKQFQFNKEDEEEEMNFLELCDALNNHL